MIQPLIATTQSAPVANLHQHNEAQGALAHQNASVQVQREEKQIRETVVKKEEAVFYQQKHDAKEEGRNKYANLYSKKKVKGKKAEDNEEKEEIKRVNIDIHL